MDYVFIFNMRGKETEKEKTLCIQRLIPQMHTTKLVHSDAQYGWQELSYTCSRYRIIRQKLCWGANAPYRAQAASHGMREM